MCAGVRTAVAVEERGQKVRRNLRDQCTVSQYKINVKESVYVEKCRDTTANSKIQGKHDRVESRELKKFLALALPQTPTRGGYIWYRWMIRSCSHGTMTEDDAKSEGSTSQASSTDPSKLMTDSVGAATEKTDEITAVQDSIGKGSNRSPCSKELSVLLTGLLLNA